MSGSSLVWFSCNTPKFSGLHQFALELPIDGTGFDKPKTFAKADTNGLRDQTIRVDLPAYIPDPRRLRRGPWPR
jgi:hypothetical protein